MVPATQADSEMVGEGRDRRERICSPRLCDTPLAGIRTETTGYNQEMSLALWGWIGLVGSAAGSSQHSRAAHLERNLLNS
jgi:hypothetical protein